jgi:hypothetical protein
MNRVLIMFLVVLSECGSVAAERIKKNHATPVEAERMASDMAMNDNLLRKGDIVATDRAFYSIAGWRTMDSTATS